MLKSAYLFLFLELLDDLEILLRLIGRRFSVKKVIKGFAIVTLATAAVLLAMEQANLANYIEGGN